MNFPNLIHWAVVFVIVAIVTALLGFGMIAGTAMEGAKIVFWLALAVAAVSFLFGMLRRA